MELSFNLRANEVFEDPFRHSFCSEVLPWSVVSDVLDWCDNYQYWKHKTLPNFLSLYSNRPSIDEVPTNISWLFSENAFYEAKTFVEKSYDVNLSNQVDIQFQKMSSGDFVRIHSDYHNEKQQTHRFLVHFNKEWNETNGGFFMLFGDKAGGPDISNPIAYLPKCNFAFVFEISELSHHAVSQVHDGNRYTLMYSFRAQN